MHRITMIGSLLLALAGGVAGAQEEKKENYTVIEGRKVRLVQEDLDQGKASLSSFTEDPVVGEDREARIRKNIPALMAATRTETRYVDPDNLYERRMAMVEHGDTYTRALPRMTSPDGEVGEEEVRKRSLAPVQAEESGHGVKIIIVAVFLSICMGLYWISHRGGRQSSS